MNKQVSEYARGTMIVFNLQCGDGHGFEAWFKDAKAFESQRRARKVACPVCGGTKVGKVPAAPRISKGVSQNPSSVDHARLRSAEYMTAIEQLQKHVEENCDYVGDRFAQEARDIHNGITEERGIYGQATTQEAKDLADEGVPFATLPKRRSTDA